MIMRSPSVAILWELWRITRTEIAWKLALPIGGGLAALMLCAVFAPPDDPRRYEAIMGFGAVIAMTFLIIPNFLNWVSLARMNGGRPGFTLYLSYSRPVRTTVIVGLPMAYVVTVSAAIYLVSALLLKAISGYPFPLLPVAAWMAALSVILTAAYWSSRSMVALVLGSMLAVVTWGRFADHRVNSFPNDFDWHDSPKLWSTIFDFPLTDYAVIALISLASYAVTVVKVAQQRRGDAQAAVTLTSGGGLWGRLVDLFRLPCPHLVRSARSDMVGPEVEWIAGDDDRSSASDRGSAVVVRRQSHRCGIL
jgi:hypothetical protein